MHVFTFFLIAFVSLSPEGEKHYKKVRNDTGSLTAEGWMLDGKKVDFWFYYYSNGKIKAKGHYSNDKKTDYWHYYSANGKLEAEGHYADNKRTLWWSFYDKDGVLKYKFQFQNGVKNGYCLVYKNDEIVKAAKYVNGIKLKEWSDYDQFTKENNLLDLR